VVLSAAEDTARVLAERQPFLAGAAVVGPDREVYAALCDKGRLAATAGLAGVGHPETVVVAADGTHGPWPPLPSVVKPRISGEDIGDLPAAVPVSTPSERAAAVTALTAAGRQAIVQEFVTGERWVAQSVRDHDGRLDIVCSFIERDHPRGAGVASRMRVDPDPPPEVPAAVERLLGLTGYAGPSTISFIGHGDRWKVHDVNLRLGSSVGLVIRAGLDMPRRAVEVALGLPPSPPPRPRPNAYARLDGEVGAIADAMRGRAHGESPLGVARGLLHLAVGRRGMVDPSPLEPFLWTRLAAIGGWSVVRRAHRVVCDRRAG
jgi:predicted ATP-grasp superfamily ATP-dependent carboligase